MDVRLEFVKNNFFFQKIIDNDFTKFEICSDKSHPLFSKIIICDQRKTTVEIAKNVLQNKIKNNWNEYHRAKKELDSMFLDVDAHVVIKENSVPGRKPFFLISIFV